MWGLYTLTSINELKQTLRDHDIEVIFECVRHCIKQDVFDESQHFEGFDKTMALWYEFLRPYWVEIVNTRTGKKVLE